MLHSRNKFPQTPDYPVITYQNVWQVFLSGCCVVDLSELSIFLKPLKKRQTQNVTMNNDPIPVKNF